VQVGPQQHSPAFGACVPHLQDEPQFLQEQAFASLMRITSLDHS
jgi:hypothetical protein